MKTNKKLIYISSVAVLITFLYNILFTEFLVELQIQQSHLIYGLIGSHITSPIFRFSLAMLIILLVFYKKRIYISEGAKKICSYAPIVFIVIYLLGILINLLALFTTPNIGYVFNSFTHILMVVHSCCGIMTAFALRRD